MIFRQDVSSNGNGFFFFFLNLKNFGVQGLGYGIIGKEAYAGIFAG